MPHLQRGTRPRLAAMTAAKRSAGLAPFSVRSFRFQWPADLFTSWAFEMETLILGWYVLSESGSVSLLVLFGSLQYLGSLVAPLFGVAGDRAGHRRLMCAARALFAAQAAMLMAFSLTDLLTPVIVLIIASVGGILRPSDLVMRNALIAQTMPPGQLMGALAISRTTTDSARIAGALAGAAGVTAMGIGPTYVLVTSLYAFSFLLSLGVAGNPRRNPALPEPPPATPMRDLGQGFAVIWRKPELLGALSLAFLVNLLAFPFYIGLLPYVAQQVYGIDQIGLSYLVVSFSLGGLIGSIVLGMNRFPLRASRTMLVCGAFWFALVVGFASVTSMDAGLVLLFLSGLAQSICLTPLAAVMLRGAEGAFRGRVMGMRMLAIWGLPLGLLASGPIITTFGFAAAGITYGLAGLALTLAIALRWRAQLWRLAAPANARL